MEVGLRPRPLCWQSALESLPRCTECTPDHRCLSNVMLTALRPAEVYLGKWHGCDAAVKCLNPGLFFGGGDLQNHSAVADLVKEADILGRCR
jgi:hypothetical protein